MTRLVPSPRAFSGGQLEQIPPRDQPAVQLPQEIIQSIDLADDVRESSWLDKGRIAALARLEEFASRPFARQIAVLPDCHWKPDMELPSSVAVDCGDTIVPDVTSVALNDCMSLVLTDWTKDRVEAAFLADYFDRVNSQASSRRSGLTRYSPSRHELIEMLYGGAAAAVHKFGLPSSVLDAIERRGQLPVDDIPTEELRRLVPRLLLAHRGFRAEFGLNFGGNHFLEVQYVSDVVEPQIARAWNIVPGQVVLMTHLGPGPFTGNLLHLYSRRQKIRPGRRAAYGVLKAGLHLTMSGRASWRERYRAYFGDERFRGFPLESEIGRDLDRVIRLGSNFGFAYQVGCYKAVTDALSEAAHASGLPHPNPRLFWSVSHNHLWQETISDAPTIIGRHNSVRAYEGRPALLAGRNDVDTCLGLGLDGGAEFLHSYDHGVGALLGRADDAGKLPALAQTSRRFQFRRGAPGDCQSAKEVPLRSRDLVERVMAALAQRRIVKPVCFLRPLGTMHN